MPTSSRSKPLRANNPDADHAELKDRAVTLPLSGWIALLTHPT